ncbi:MAG: hypothetical protein JJ855_17905 [Rhodospirillales bacterium]|nr:hypothetical protein [Rhodospirillales bacterium]
MTLTRRKSLALIGGGIVFAATAGVTTFALTRTPTTAQRPWTRAGRYDEPRLRALSYALLAPNPHNRQPWLADLSEPGTVILHRDKARQLPHTDPYSRQLVIGMGCFIELMRMAAAEDGYDIDFDFYPEGEDGPVTVARFQPGGRSDPLFHHVLERRSCKEPFEDRGLPPALADTLQAYAHIVTEQAKVSAIREITLNAWGVETTTPRTMRESVELMRFGKDEINANPDGIALGGPFLESLMVLGALEREDQMDVTSSSFKSGQEMYIKMLNATPAYAYLTTPANTRLEQLEAGRRWLRLNLATTKLGLGLHPVSQALQEFPEMDPQYQEIHRLLAKPGHTVQMLGRLGFGPTVQPAPRWPIESRILKS